ncbi:MAG: CTP synthetase [Candidatus Aenigmatarchaeota archaeon]|nr:MAG: CTP synthetase [Candidatus Aenigmarchaeota archaeon]
MPGEPKWIFITGGVLSGLGKGIVSASVSKLLQARGLKVVPIKCDGYLNVDPGTMNPIEHGEVFVLDDGGEVDMDFGHYERFLGLNCRFDWNLTSGKIFKSVIDKEREGKFLGQTVQMIPHVTDEIIGRLGSIAEEEKPDVMVVEIGGTVGDIENMLFLEAVRQMRNIYRDSMLIHLTLVPVLDVVGEQKTKPTQHSVRELQRVGLDADVIIGRSKEKLDKRTKKKISLFCNVPPENVISDPDIDNIYEIPLLLEEEGLDRIMVKHLGLGSNGCDLGKWRELVENMKKPERRVKVGICGKYTKLEDSYVSIVEALRHAAAHQKAEVELKWVETTDIEKGECDLSVLKDVNGVIIPGGFGSRGAEGKIEVIRYARENGIPILGLCFGLQLMVVEFARNVCGLKGANTTEVDENTKHPVIDILPEQKKIVNKGGTMRLGGYEAHLKEGTLVRKLYGKPVVRERHRHRYEVNPDYHEILERNGLVLSGMNENLVEFIELKNHPFYLGTQAHPEFTSSLEKPNPCFYGFVKALLK